MFKFITDFRKILKDQSVINRYSSLRLDFIFIKKRFRYLLSALCLTRKKKKTDFSPESPLRIRVNNISFYSCSSGTYLQILNGA